MLGPGSRLPPSRKNDNFLAKAARVFYICSSTLLKETAELSASVDAIRAAAGRWTRALKAERGGSVADVLNRAAQVPGIASREGLRAEMRFAGKWRRKGLKRLNPRPEMVWPRQPQSHNAARVMRACFPQADGAKSALRCVSSPAQKRGGGHGWRRRARKLNVR